MASWDLTIEMPAADVIGVLRELPDADVVDTATGIGIGFGQGRAAWVDIANPDAGPDLETDIVIKDPETLGAWQLYDFLEQRTDAPMQMWNDGGLLVKERRWVPVSGRGAIDTAKRRLESWDSREVGLRLIELATSAPLTSEAVRAVIADSGVASSEVRDRSLEVAGELVRAGLLRPGVLTAGSEGTRLEQCQGSVQDLVFQTYALFPRDVATDGGEAGVLSVGPVVSERIGDPITIEDVRRWMQPVLLSTDSVSTDSLDPTRD